MSPRRADSFGRSGAHDRVAAAVEAFYEAERPVGLSVGVLPSAETTGPFWSFHRGRIGGDGSPPPDDHTLWQIGSITKTFTATALAAAVRDLGIALTDPAQSLVPTGVSVPFYATWQGQTPIRLQHLATHTAGLPLDPARVPPGGYSVLEFYRDLGGYALGVRPGTSWTYSNVGFGLLANILIELLSLPDYQALVSWLKGLTGLPLADTVVTLDPDQTARRALGFVDPHHRAIWRTATWPAFDGSGALSSTLADQMVWLAFNMGLLESPANTLLPILQHVYFESDAACMGLAWQYAPLPGTTRRYLSKSGNTNGFNSYTAFVVDRAGGVVVLCNTASAWPQSLVETILSILVEDQP